MGDTDSLCVEQFGDGDLVNEDNTSAADDTDSAACTHSDAPALSKRALKKLKKRQDWLDNKHERRKKEKEKRKLKMAARQQNKDYAESRTASRKSLKFQGKMSDSPCKVSVVFDMQFSDLMTERDLGKCIKQGVVSNIDMQC